MPSRAAPLRGPARLCLGHCLRISCGTLLLCAQCEQLVGRRCRGAREDTHDGATRVLRRPRRRRRREGVTRNCFISWSRQKGLVLLGAIVVFTRKVGCALCGQAERILTMTKQLNRSAQRAATGHRDGEAQRVGRRCGRRRRLPARRGACHHLLTTSPPTVLVALRARLDEARDEEALGACGDQVVPDLSAGFALRALLPDAGRACRRACQPLPVGAALSTQARRPRSARSAARARTARRSARCRPRGRPRPRAAARVQAAGTGSGAARMRPSPRSRRW